MCTKIRLSKMLIIIYGMVLTFSSMIDSKVFERCELAKTLRYKYNTSVELLPTWMCIAFHESSYNTKAYNTETHDYGLFQISEIYWCNVNPNDHKLCGVKCTDLFSDDITDSVKCSRVVYNVYKKAKKDPFSAWVAYNTKCKKEGNLNKYIAGCFKNKHSQSYCLTS